VRLPAGSRVQDAIAAAGGATSGADLDAVNLARKLTDGEQVRVTGPGDPPPPPEPGAATIPGTPSTPLDLNTATVEQLDPLPGVGEVTAGRIVAYRAAHPFTSVDELLEVPGIGQRRFDQLRDLVTVGGLPPRPRAGAPRRRRPRRRGGGAGGGHRDRGRSRSPVRDCGRVDRRGLLSRRGVPGGG